MGHQVHSAWALLAFAFSALLVPTEQSRVSIESPTLLAEDAHADVTEMPTAYLINERNQTARDAFRIQALSSQVSDLDAVMRDLREEVGELRDELQDATGDIWNTFSAQNQRTSESISGLQSSVGDLPSTDRIMDLESEVGELRDELRVATGDIWNTFSAQNQRTSESISGLQSSVGDLQSTDRKMESYESAVESLQSRFGNWTRFVSSMQSDVGHLQETDRNRESQQSTLQYRISNLERNQYQNFNQYQNLSQSIRHLTSATDNLQVANRWMRSRFTSVESRVLDLERAP